MEMIGIVVKTLTMFSLGWGVFVMFVLLQGVKREMFLF